MHRLKDKVALVVGAGGLQGRVVARRMGEEGASIVAADLAGDRLDAVVDNLRSHGIDARDQRIDVTSEEDWAALVSFAEWELGRVDVLVITAAVLGRQGVEGTTMGVWRQVIDTNQLGPWLGIKHAAPALRRAGGGSIVLISSIDGLVGRGNAAAYGASKAAVRLLARNAAVELAPDWIRVNTVCPGVMETTMSVVLDEGERRADRLERTPLKRVGTADDVAWAVVYLASDEAGYVTGSDLVVDGGYTAQ